MTNASGGSTYPTKLGAIADLVRNARLVYRLLRDRRVSTVLKIALPGLVLAYVLWPVDLLPDFLLVLGQLDDVALVALAARLFIGLAPEPVVREIREVLAHGGKTTNRSSGEGQVVDGDYRVID